MAESGDTEAQFSHTMMLDLGDGIPRNKKKAIYWLKKAAEQDLAVACYSLGIKYEFGNTVRQSSEEAANWFRKTAQQEMPMSQFHLGRLFLPGSDLRPDPVRAYAWLTLADYHGFPDALESRNIADGLLDEAERSRANNIIKQLKARIQQSKQE
ncbi:MAG: tetratricopeptide repeat protein [Desulfobulbales bacterium]